MPSREPKISVRKGPTLRTTRSTMSKRVTDRGRAALKLRGLITRFKDQVSAAFRKRFAAELRDGEAGPDHSPGLEIVGRLVMTAYGQLEDADNSYTGKATQRQRLERMITRVARDEVYPEVVALRRQLDWIFGKESSRSIHSITGRTRRKLKHLYPQLQKFVGNLANERFVLPLPKRSSTVDRHAWLSQLEPGYQQLTKMLKSLGNLQKREDYLRQARDIELEDFDALYGEAHAYVRAVFRMAGHTDRELDRITLTHIERRRLRREARGEREARAEGRRSARDPWDEPDEGGSPRVA